MKNITVIIVTYNTPEKIILDCLKSIPLNIEVLIVENSKNLPYQEKITSQFSNTNVVCTGENLGYGGGNNFGIKSAKTDYVLILNPDVICDEKFFTNMSEAVEEAKDFTIIGCQYLYDKIFMPAGFFENEENNEFKKKFKNNEISSLAKVEWVTGCSMLINMKKFEQKEIFDKNFFLYFEEFDLCKSVVNKGENIYTSNKLKIHHLGFKSSIDSAKDKTNISKLREWHWMWSTFYFYKKNYSYLYALKKVLGKFFKSFFKLVFYSIIFDKSEKQKYLYRFLGITNAMLNRPSSFRIYNRN
tara:strand:+ start:2528 stop:3427 length:900 start_codon:yes stop_codon:yes gene_type:complete